MAFNVPENFVSFVNAVVAGQFRPQQKFLGQMLHGLLCSSSMMLSDIGRAIDEPCHIRHTEKRLSRNLDSERLDEELLRHHYLKHVAPTLTRRTVIAVDLSDIHKPYSEKQEGMAPTWDGSAGKTQNRGWPLLCIEAVPPNRQQVPLMTRLYSRIEASFKSDGAVVRETLDQVKGYVPLGCLWVADRGFDAKSYFRMFTNAGLDWAIRLVGNRNVIDRDGVQYLAEKYAETLVLPHTATFTSIHKRRKVEHEAAFAFRRVTIPKLPGRYSLVVAWFTSGHTGKRRPRPMMILTNRDIRSRTSALAIINGYFCRWGVEESIRSTKTLEGIENVRVMNLRRIKRLVQLAAIAQGYLALLALKGRKWVVRLVKHLTKNFGAVPRYVRYQVGEAVGKLLGEEGLAWPFMSPGAIRGEEKWQRKQVRLRVF
jgi:hypothetical protein